MQGLQILVCGAVHQRLEIDVQHIIAQYGGGGFAGNTGGVCGRILGLNGIVQNQVAAGFKTGNHPGHIHPEIGQQAQLVDTGVGIHTVVVHIVGAQGIGATEDRQAQHQKQLQYNRSHHGSHTGLPCLHGLEREILFTQYRHGDQRQGHQQQGNDTG